MSSVVFIVLLLFYLCNLLLVLLIGSGLRSLFQCHVSDQDWIGQTAVFSEPSHRGVGYAADSGLWGPGSYGHGGLLHFPGGSRRPRRHHAPRASYRHSPHHGKSPRTVSTSQWSFLFLSILIVPQEQQHWQWICGESLAGFYNNRAGTYCSAPVLLLLYEIQCSFVKHILACWPACPPHISRTKTLWWKGVAVCVLCCPRSEWLISFVTAIMLQPFKRLTAESQRKD